MGRVGVSLYNRRIYENLDGAYVLSEFRSVSRW